MEEKSLPLQKWRTGKVHCDFCDEEAAVLFCHADSAKLCLFCDQHIHSANALSRKHQHPQICNNCDSFWLGGFPACPSRMRMAGGHIADQMISPEDMGWVGVQLFRIYLRFPVAGMSLHPQGRDSPGRGTQPLHIQPHDGSNKTSIKAKI